MRRDVLPTKSQGTNVSDNQIGNSSSDKTSPRISAVEITEVYQPGDHQYSNKTSLVDNQFYRSYDPEVGINTASFLGGILVILVIYVIYRTKCRKRLLKLCQNCSMKYFPEEFANISVDKKESADKLFTNESQWISENAKMIWQERTHLSLNREPPSIVLCSNDGDKDVERGDNCLCLHSPDMQIVENTNELDINPPQLPDYEENIEQATAHWVQNVKYMDIKERQLNGILLKIPPELVSHNAKIRSHFHSVTDYGDQSNDSVNISQRNKSLPSLIEQQMCQKSNYASVSMDTNQRSSSRIYVPLATEEDDSLDFPPNQFTVPYQTGTRVPIDICPIIKVQHYHSRSKRRLTSLNHSSTDENSSSSDDHRLATNMEPKAASDAKYMRLDHSDDHDHDAPDHRLGETEYNGDYMLVASTDTECMDDSRIPAKYMNHNSRPVKSLETNL